MNNLVEIGKRLKQIRQYYDETQEAFALRIKVEQSMLSRYESGKTKIPDETRLELLVLNINLDWLDTGKGKMHHDNTIKHGKSIPDNHVEKSEVIKQILTIIEDWDIDYINDIKNIILGYSAGVKAEQKRHK